MPCLCRTNPEKRKQTNLKLRGVECPFASKDVQNKCEKHFIEVYGVRRPAQNSEINAKCRTSFQYDGQNFRSSWELAYYIWLIDHNIKFVFQPKNMAKTYYCNGIAHVYFPDFYLLKSKTLIEIKGDQFINKETNTPINIFLKNHKNAQALIQAKFECMYANNVKILFYEDLKPILKYCIEKYHHKKWYLQFKRSKNII